LSFFPRGCFTAAGMGTTSHPTAAKANQVRVAMQQKTDGRVVRLLTKYVGAEGRPIEQWFLVAIGDDDKATDAVAKSANAADAVFEIIGHIPATTLASWGMTEGEVRLVLPGEPISG
jgi:hypothetical protein